MRNIFVWVALSACALMLAFAARGSEPEAKPATMLSRLKVGQQVRLVRFPNGGGYNVELPNDRYIKNFERSKRQKYVASKITEIGSDFIAVTSPDGTETTIAAHLIEVITKLPEIKAEADEPPGK
jgi:hypothetical protein